MILALVLLYVVSLVYISITERFRSYASLVGLQGWLLLAIALVRLQQIEIWSLFFVVAETLLFKAIVVPAILFAVIRRTKINRIAASGTSQFNSLVLSLAALVASISVTYCIAEETINLVFFGVALYALLSGLILIVVRKRRLPLLDGRQGRDALDDRNRDHARHPHLDPHARTLPHQDRRPLPHRRHRPADQRKRLTLV